MRIALIKTGALGDVVRTTALVPALRRDHPGLHLTWITAPSALDLVAHNREIDRAVTLDDPADAPWRSEAYDWIISLDDGRAECRLATALAGSGGRISGGFEAPDGTLTYSADVEPWFGMGILRSADRGGLAVANELKKTNEKTVAALLYECLGLSAPVGRTTIPVPEAAAREAAGLLRSVGLEGRRPLVGLNKAGRAWRSEQEEDSSAELARRLHDKEGAGVVVLGGPAEADRNARIVAGAGRPGIVAAPTDLSLMAFTALLGRLDLLVTSDSLALHLAVSQGVPVVSFFGPRTSRPRRSSSTARARSTSAPLYRCCCYRRSAAFGYLRCRRSRS